MLVLLDDNGAETARQELDLNDGWAFAAMQERDGTLFVLARDMFGGDTPELRAFDAKTLTALETQTLPSGTLGLGLDENGTFLLTDSDALLSFDLTTGKVQTIGTLAGARRKDERKPCLSDEKRLCALFSKRRSGLSCLMEGKHNEREKGSDTGHCGRLPGLVRIYAAV